MQEDLVPGVKVCSQAEINDLEKQFSSNKQVMFDILTKAPKVGVYKNQTQAEWEGFFQFYINFLKSELGPRGDCAKAIRQKLLADQQRVAQLLTPFKLRPQMHIRQIYTKIKAYIPCPEYTEMKKIHEARQKFQQNISRFEDENSPMVKHISQGLIKKHGENYDIKSQLAALKANYVQRLKQADEYLDKLTQTLEKSEGYFQLLAVEKYFEPYFAEWKLADSEMGKQNCKTGYLFQEKVFKTMLPYIYYRQTHDKSWIYSDKELEVFQNLSWIPRNLGEIDIALGYKDKTENRYFITTLIQCKSRFFDLREAYRQVSLQNEGGINKGPTFEELKAIKKIKMQMQKSKSKKKSAQEEQNNEQSDQKSNEAPQTLVINNKKFLSTKYGPAELVENHHFYIITTLPQNQFLLPIESKMKEGIEKYTRNMFLQDILNQSQPLYSSLKERFENVLSPLDWLKQYQAKWKGNDSNILVLK